MTENALTSLEVFLMTLVDQGWNTPYKLREGAGISVGGALPALNRLKDRKLLQKAEVAARNKQEFEVTAAGKKAIASEMKRLLKKFQESPPSDTESALRLAALAFFGKRRGMAVSLLKKVGQARGRVDKPNSHDTARIVATDLASLYRSMSRACDAARIEAESDALISLAKKLKQIKP